MKKIRNLVLGGIEQKIFNMILITVAVIVLALTGLILYQNNTLSALSADTAAQQQKAISEMTSGVMDTVVAESLDRSTVERALLADTLFSRVRTRVRLLADYARKLYTERPAPAPLTPPDPARHGEITAQAILADYADPEEMAETLGIAQNMADMMISLYTVSEAVDSCFVAVPGGGFLVVNEDSGSKFDENGQPVPYDACGRFWYQQAVETGDLIFTDVEQDAFTDNIGIVCAMPVYVDGTLAAVVGSDLYLTAMRDAVDASEEAGGFVCIVNRNGHVVFAPESESAFRVLRSTEAADLRHSDNAALAALVGEALQGTAAARPVQIGDRVYYMAGALMETPGWALLSVYDRELADEPAHLLQAEHRRIQEEAVTAYRASSSRLRRFGFIAVMLLTALVLAGSLILGRRIVRPLNTITKRIAALDESDPEFRMEDAYRTGDEIEELAKSFADLSHKTVLYVDQVRKVTAEKERIGTELRMATRIQESMLPHMFPPYPDRREFDLFASMDPAREVGGDFYDFFLIDDDHRCVVMADVSGKGVPAALYMMISKVIIQSCAMLGRRAGEILNKTNEALCHDNQTQMFVTVWLGILEISTGTMTCANAGHEYPALLRDGRFGLLRRKHGFVIGGLSGVRYTEYEIRLERGDKLFLYTDGVPEATDAGSTLFGTDRMLEALNRRADGTPREIVAQVRAEVDAFVGSAEQFDDMTMLCLEYKGA